MFNAQPSNNAPITPVNGERKMGLMSRIFGGKLAANNEAGNVGHNLNKSSVLANTDSAVPTPQNADFSSIRTAPVVPKPRYFTAVEAGALQNLAAQKREQVEHTKKAYKALKGVDTSDRVVHQLHRGYQSKVAQNEVAKLKSNAELAEHLHALRPEYERLNQRVDVADRNASDAINSIRQSYGA